MGNGNSTRPLVWLLIGGFCAGALLLIVVIQSGGELDETSAKAIGTAIALALFSLTGVAGMNLARRRPQLALLGYLAAAVSLFAFLAVTATIWNGRLSSDDGWRIAVDATIVAIGSGHASLLLGSARAADSEIVRLARTGVILTIALLCLMAIVEIASPGRDIGAKPIAIVAVLYVLGTILLPLLRRVTSEPAEQSP